MFHWNLSRAVAWTVADVADPGSRDARGSERIVAKTFIVTISGSWSTVLSDTCSSAQRRRLEYTGQYVWARDARGDFDFLEQRFLVFKMGIFQGC